MSGVSSDHEDDLALKRFEGFGNTVLGSEVVTVYIGKEKIRRSIHKTLLCDNSPYFATMFNGAFEEATTQTTCDAETTVEVFDLFLPWLYIRQSTLYLRFIEATDCNEFKWYDELLVAFYIFADRYMSLENLKKTLVDRGSEAHGFGYFKLTVKDLLTKAVYSSIRDLSENDLMRQGVINRACKALLQLRHLKEWLYECTANIDTGLHPDDPLEHITTHPFPKSTSWMSKIKADVSKKQQS